MAVLMYNNDSTNLSAYHRDEGEHPEVKKGSTQWFLEPTHVSDFNIKILDERFVVSLS